MPYYHIQYYHLAMITPTKVEGVRESTIDPDLAFDYFHTKANRIHGWGRVKGLIVEQLLPGDPRIARSKKERL